MTELVTVPAPPTVPPFPALGDPNFNQLAYDNGSAMPGVSAGLQAIALTAFTNATVAGEKAAEAALSKAAADADAVATAADRAQTGADRTQTGLDRTAAAASAVQASKLNLGSKATPPTVDNQGAALLAGATYYDITLAKWRVWAGVAWGDGISAVAGVSSINGQTGDVTGIATTGANIFTAAQNLPTGAAIASAATVNLDTATGNRLHITGTTTISAVTLTRGPRTVIFDGILTLTHHATNNNLPGAANITTAAGDRAIYESDGTTVYCVSYTMANGSAVISQASGLVCLAVASASSVATVDFTTLIDATYDAYVFELLNVISATSGSVLYMRTSGNSGFSFDSDSSDYKYTLQGSYDVVDVSERIRSAADSKIILSGDSTGGHTGRIFISRPSATTLNKHMLIQGISSDSSGYIFATTGGAVRRSTSAINAVRFLFASGNIASGLFKLYGVRKVV